MNRHEFEKAYLAEWAEEPKPYDSGIYVARFVLDRYDIVHSDKNLWDYIKINLSRQIFDKIGEQLLCGTPVVVRAEYVTWDRFDSFDRVIELRVQVQKTQTMNVVIPKFEPIEFDFGKKVHVDRLCAACGNVWHEDRHGACNSCGAPANWTLK